MVPPSILPTEGKSQFRRLPLTSMSAACQRHVSSLSANPSAAMSAANRTSGPTRPLILGAW